MVSSIGAQAPAAPSYGIGFSLALPEEWNGRFLFQGGGLNGDAPSGVCTDEVHGD